ncbi:MAG: hypothetical protein K2J62_02605 [Bacteroidales bacterium]|nr:hypothetical protein [Bacteroidales bacterium]
MFRPQKGFISWTRDCYDNDSSVTGCFFGNLKTGTGDLGPFRTGQELADKTGAAYNVLQREADTARSWRQEHERAQGTHDASRSCMTAVGWLRLHSRPGGPKGRN